MGKIIENGNYCVYIHTSPSGKMYVGQTGKKPEERWGKDGVRYLHKRKNSKSIIQYSMLYEPIGVYKDMMEAELKTGIDHSNISACCNGRRKSAGGYIWQYYKDTKKEVI